MKRLNYLYIGALSMLLSGGLVSCEDDLEHYTVEGLTPTSDFALSESKVQIDEENLSEEVLKLNYTKSDLRLTNSSEAISMDGGYILVQASKSESFSDYKTFAGSNLSSLKGDDLNKMATALGLQPNTEGVMYLRLVSSYGQNSEVSYNSNVVKLNVTPLEIDSHWAYIYTKDADEKFTVKSSQYLFSSDNDGKYQGFINAEAWLNFGVMTEDGTLYGSGPDNWTFLSYSAGGDHFWLTAKAGCYYFTMDTKNTSQLADAYLINSLSCGGDINNASMVYDAAKSAWYAYIVVPKDNSNVTISGTAEHYQSSQADADEIVNVGFSGTQNAVKFSLGEEGTGVTIPEKGTYKITLKLGLNSKYKFTLEPAEVTVYPDKVTLSGSELVTEVLDGAATGVYTGFVQLKSGNQDIVYSDAKDYGVKLDVKKDGWYMITVDLVKKRAEAVLYGNTLTISGSFTGELTVQDGKYKGFLTSQHTESYDFFVEDENGQKYATYKGWDQFTFGVSEGDYNHLWFNPEDDYMYIEIDVLSHSWTGITKFNFYFEKEEPTTLLGTAKLNADGLFVGEYTPKADAPSWDFYMFDNNKVLYGTYQGWDQFTIGVSADGYDHHWLDNSKQWIVSIDLQKHTFTAVEKTE